MTAAAEKIKMMRRRGRGVRVLHLVVADARSRAVRRRVAKQVAGLNRDREREALQWIETVSEFDAHATPSRPTGPNDRTTAATRTRRSW
jgi:hypothetical protein